MSPTPTTTMKSLTLGRSGVRTRRESSWDRKGGNVDARPIPAGATLTVAELKGPGCITHLWFTIAPEDHFYLRSLVLRMWWDGEKEPSVEVPIGDFFGLGHARMRAYQCFPFNVTSGGGEVGENSALNCYFQMPFGKSARITVENQGPSAVSAFYYYVDYETYSSPLPKDTLRFHAQWRRENPTQGIKGHLAEKGINYWSLRDEPNLDGKENYLILDAKGHGHYVGCNLSIDNFEPTTDGLRTWWGEGDDMIFIDGEKLPSLVGTGSEDYFGHAWGMQDKAGLYSGVTVWHRGADIANEKITCYRYHIEDPVVFNKSIRVTIEHGHANLQNHDYASTAFWYQAEPHAKFPALPSREDRMPRRDVPMSPSAVLHAEGPWTNPANRIKDWAVIGPFERPVGRDPEAGSHTVYDVEKHLAALAKPAGLALHFTTKAGDSAWTRVPDSALGGGAVDLRRIFLSHANYSVAYLMTRIHATKARKMRLWFSHDDGAKLWLNGKELYCSPGPHAMFNTPPSEVDLDLKVGDNVLVLKVDQLAGAWGAWAYLGEPTKKSVRKAKPATKVVRKDLECWVELGNK